MAIPRPHLRSSIAARGSGASAEAPTAYTLMNPGPINVSDRVRRALALSPDQCHREPEYLEMQSRTREKLARAFGVEGSYDALLLTGSGTAAMEAMVVSSTGTGLLVVDNGVYGDRICQIAEAYAIPHRRFRTESWFVRPDLDDLKRALKPELDTIAVVHHETTTGLLNDLPGIARLAKETNRRLLVDGVSSLGGETFDFAKVSPEAVGCTANKCVQGLPGIAFVLVKKGARLRRRSLYFDLGNVRDHQERGDTPFTPAIQVVAALEAAVDELIEETVAARIRRYRAAAERVRAAAEAIGLKRMLPKKLLSNTITSFELPKDVTYQQVHDRMKEDGFVIYGGQGDLRKTAFRVANMGVIPDEALARFPEALRRAVT
jgi:2-aminoethylphosphonate-pyruvate transaminase